MFKTLKKKLKDQRGLTLIELLAVIVILGIIAAIAIPSIGGIINKSKDDAKVAEALQIIGAAKLAHSSNSEVITWTHDGAVATSTVAKKGKLSDFVQNVEDNSYEVTYSGGVYTITGHVAAGVAANAGNDTSITEAELLAHTK